MATQKKLRPKQRARGVRGRADAATFDETALPSLKQMVEWQRQLDEAAPLLIDPEVNRLNDEAKRRGEIGIIGPFPAWAPIETVAQQLKTYQETLLGSLPPECEGLSAEQLERFLRMTEAVPEEFRRRFALNFATSAHAAERETGRKVRAGSNRGAEERARPYRARQPAVEQGARNYWRKRPNASIREVAVGLERCKFGPAETLRKKIAHLKPKKTTGKKTG